MQWTSDDIDDILNNNEDCYWVPTYGWGPHNWRKYVPEWMRPVWAQLPVMVRLCVAEVCEEIADNEEWD